MPVPEGALALRPHVPGARLTTETVIRALCVGVALAGAETLHGIVRMKFLAPRVGKARAVKIAIVSGSLIAFGVCYALVPMVGLSGTKEHLVLGAALAAFMASFDLALGIFLLRRPWSKALEDFNPAKGNYLVFGLVLLACFPAIVEGLRAGR